MQNSYKRPNNLKDRNLAQITIGEKFGRDDSRRDRSWGKMYDTKIIGLPTVVDSGIWTWTGGSSEIISVSEFYK